MLVIINFLFLLPVVIGNEKFCFQTISTDQINARESYFGYTVHLRIDNNHLGHIIVGAPKANSTYKQHQGINEPGVVFLCSIDDSTCRQYILDKEGNSKHNVRFGLHYKHRKDEGWLGAVVTGDDSLSGVLVVCSPKWINQYYSNKVFKNLPFFLNGLCYVLDDASNVQDTARTIIPLQNTNYTYSGSLYNYAYGEGGFSLHYIENSDLIIGAPGVLDWQGTIANYKLPYSIGTLSVIDRTNRNHIPDKYTYFGYSTSSGRFLASSRRRWYLTGAPRGSYLKGEVYIYDIVNNNIDLKYKLTGNEMGEYFGYSTTVLDINNDGIDEIVVGAPIHSYHNNKTDSGRIYLFNSDGHGNFYEGNVLNQYSEKNARIGTAISSVGDVNNDGYNDLVVGAPYGFNRRGFVMVCYGYELGLKCDAPIYSTTVARDLEGFGMSISQGIDLDSNGINDFVVGSPLSGHVVLFRSRSRVYITSEFFSSPSRMMITTERITVTTCLTYMGENVPESMDIRRSIKFNDDRVEFSTSSGSVRFWSRKNTLVKEIRNCLAVEMNVKDARSSLEKPLMLILTYGTESHDQQGCNPYYQGIETLKIDYVMGCEDENNCQSDLVVSGEYNWTRPSLVLGSTEYIQLFAYVVNEGDPAFNCRLYVTLPEYVRFYKISDKCTDFNETKTEHCFNIGRHLRKNEKRKIILFLKLDVKEMLFTDKLIVKLNASSSSNERHDRNNIQDVVLPLGIDENLGFTSNSIPDTLSNNKPERLLKFKTIINNVGPSPLNSHKIEMFVPVTVNKIKILKLQQLDVVLKVFKDGTKDELSCTDEGINTLSPLLNLPKVNDTTDSNHLYITEHSDDLNVDYRKFSCEVTKIFFVKDQINVQLPAYVEINKFNKIDKTKTVIHLYTYLIVYKSGGETEDNVIVTKILMVKDPNLSAWIGGCIGISLICLAIIALILYKCGCFQRKTQRLIQAQKVSRREQDDESEAESLE